MRTLEPDSAEIPYQSLGEVYSPDIFQRRKVEFRRGDSARPKLSRL